MKESSWTRTGLTLLLTMYFVGLSAQGKDFYKDLLKESLDLDLIFEAIDTRLSPDTTSRNITLNTILNPIPRMSYNLQQNSLFLHYKDTIPEIPQPDISPYALWLWVSNQETFDPNSTETATDIVANGILTPLLAVGTFNILVLADYLMRIGVLPDEPFVSKEQRRAKKLREIKNLYNMD